MSFSQLGLQHVARQSMLITILIELARTHKRAAWMHSKGQMNHLIKSRFQFLINSFQRMWINVVAFPVLPARVLSIIVEQVCCNKAVWCFCMHCFLCSVHNRTERERKRIIENRCQLVRIEICYYAFVRVSAMRQLCVFVQPTSQRVEKVLWHCGKRKCM